MSVPDTAIERRRFLEYLVAAGLVLRGGLPLAATGCGPGREAVTGDTGEEDVFWYAVITDLHVQARVDHVNNAMVARVLELIAGLPVPLDLLVITGDLVDELPSDDPAEYAGRDDTAIHRLRDLLAAAPVPVRLVLGNHDYRTHPVGGDEVYTQQRAAREALFAEVAGLEAPWYRFDHRGIAFYALNSMQKDDRVAWEPGECGSFGEAQLAWLEDRLADGRPCFLFLHHPLATDAMVVAGMQRYTPFEVPRDEGGYEKYQGTVYDGWTDPIYGILQRHAGQVLAVFVGHGHWFVHDAWAGIPVMMGDSTGNSLQQTEWEGEPMRWHLVEVRPGRGTFSIYNLAAIPIDG